MVVFETKVVGDFNILGLKTNCFWGDFKDLVVFDLIITLGDIPWFCPRQLVI